MVTDRDGECAEILDGLNSGHWAIILTAIEAAALFIERAPPGDTTLENLAVTLGGLSNHEKWEIRRAVARMAGRILIPAFEPALVRLAADDNARVRQAAQQSALRRRDWRNASALGRQHEERVNATLHDIEARFGVRGREAVKRASERIANTFARELYHEIIRLMSPLVTAADRLRAEATSGEPTPAVLSRQAELIGRQVAHLRSVLDAMRAYAAMPHLEFATESIHEIVDEAANVARASKPDATHPAIEVDIPALCSADVARSRLVQALTNLLVNALESYEGLGYARGPVMVRAVQAHGVLTLSITDSGCGMSPEVLQDAPTLFSTNKRGGTGIGLPLAIKIIESEHGGRVNLDSTKGSGTLVQVMIPSHRAIDT